MKYIKTLMGSLVVLALLTTTYVKADVSTIPSEQLSPWTFAVDGGGSTKFNVDDSSYNSSAVGGDFDLGYSTKIVEPSQVGVRQAVSYSDLNGESWNLGTKVYNDWTVIRVGNVELDGGGNIGATYGNEQFDWQVSPEAEGRLYLKKDVNFFGRAEYPYSITKGEFTKAIVYKFGLEVRF